MLQLILSDLFDLTEQREISETDGFLDRRFGRSDQPLAENEVSVMLMLDRS
ncbi:hypothetical protein QUB68_06975 [Microcoleus sp. A006_D1]|uniref:hypothetical protein n=1 Tax=Microcoleus sp. A006_D1 TaxID=3055267 RepID=UPI002FD47CC6